MKTPFITNILKRVAPRIGAKLIIEPEYEFVGQIILKNGKKAYFNNRNFNINPLGSVMLVKDKAYTKFFLNKLGYKTPKGQTFFSEKLNSNIKTKRTIDDGFLYAQNIGFPVILKPNAKSQGVDVIKVYNKSSYYKAARRILKTSAVMIVEEYCDNLRDYRVVVLDNKVISAYERIPFSIIGNGKDTIETLIKNKFKKFISEKREIEIEETDPRIQESLKKQKFNSKTILEKNKKIFLLDNANLSTGGDSIDVTDTIHSSFKKIAINATRDMGLRLSGVDIMTADITKSHDYVILELNGAPGLDNYAASGKVQEQRVDELYLAILRALEK